MNKGEDRAASSAERQRVIDLLCDHYAQDRLELAEFERRLDRAHRARAQGELDALLADLPALDKDGTAVARPGRDRPESGAAVARGSEGSARPAAGTGSDLVHVPASRVPESQFEFAMWSGRTRAGAWIPARTIRAVAFMGGVELDFREAQFGPDEIRVHVAAFMGGVDIIVPPGVHVDTRGFAFLGGFDENLEGGGAASPDAPTVRISGFALMGGVDVVSRLPGESARQARQRLKEERRRRLESGQQRERGR